MCGTSMLKFKIEPPNGLELSCPAEAGNATRTLRHAGGHDKHPRRPSPPGQLQRVVRRQGLDASVAPLCNQIDAPDEMVVGAGEFAVIGDEPSP